MTFGLMPLPTTMALKKALDINGTSTFHGIQSRLGEVVAWRNTMWALSDAMAKSNVEWNGMVQPDARFGTAYRTVSQIAYPAIKNIIEASVKAAARALRDAVRVEGTELPSTKGTL